MLSCTYDNPETNIREFWRDGSPIYAEAKATIEHLISRGHILEPWFDGVISGDIRAMNKEEKPIWFLDSKPKKPYVKPRFREELKALIAKYRTNGDHFELVKYIDSQLKAYESLEKNKEKIIEKILAEAKKEMAKEFVRCILEIHDLSDDEIEEMFDGHGNTAIRVKKEQKVGNRVCVYDNPETKMREWWMDMVCVDKTPKSLVDDIVAKSKDATHEFCKPWEDGYVWGPAEGAMPAPKKPILEDNINKLCPECRQGRYVERFIHDDWEGVLHCNYCNHKVTRYQEVKVGE